MALMPTLAVPGVAVNPPLPGPASAGNVILNGINTDYHSAEYAGSLSIKWMARGEAAYCVGSNRFAVGSDQYLLLNDGQTYTMQIEAAAPVESFCVFFAPRFAADALHTLLTSEDRLLENPVGSASLAVGFFDRLYPPDIVLMNHLHRLRVGVQQQASDRLWFETQFYALLERLLHLHQNLYREVERLPCARAATREEIYRRLHHARDFMETSLEQPLALAEIAAIACLSPYHFLRLFRQMFGEPPHQYLMCRRLERAARLLLTTETPITEIALSSGLETPGSFSRLFRQRYGVAPAVYRRKRTSGAF